jgi:hypothetical protein
MHFIEGRRGPITPISKRRQSSWHESYEMAHLASTLGPVFTPGPGTGYLHPDLDGLKIIGVEEHAAFPEIMRRIPNEDAPCRQAHKGDDGAYDTARKCRVRTGSRDGHRHAESIRYGRRWNCHVGSQHNRRNQQNLTPHLVACVQSSSKT